MSERRTLTEFIKPFSRNNIYEHIPCIKLSQFMEYCVVQFPNLGLRESPNLFLIVSPSFKNVQLIFRFLSTSSLRLSGFRLPAAPTSVSDPDPNPVSGRSSVLCRVNKNINVSVVFCALHSDLVDHIWRLLIKTVKMFQHSGILNTSSQPKVVCIWSVLGLLVNWGSPVLPCH